ncbi:hypothetical protein WOLCODRAFT_102390 [Wolfiporia cocos MD-104 SS10]|uniref:EF-hand domain-containing protein n=1 Tax=Wolfiporia cocos (strain MD-104) TaxID=742152 RepID=A0A2H3K0Q7_WOLCO|nr:hypothetical protein WOLCODRAFT_102390 [Wolfiporia cocos MD-104 SS10]
MVKEVVGTVAVAVADTDAAEAVYTFANTIPAVLDLLDEIGSIHPFIGVAVVTFKTVCQLLLKRKTNDAKVVALHVEMKQTMMVLIRLKQPDLPSGDSSTISQDPLLQELIQSIADDIRKCSNACDAYSKMKTIAKVLKGPIWEKAFVEFVAKFSEHRSKLTTAISTYVQGQISTVDHKLDALAQNVQTLSDNIIFFLQSHMPSDQKAILASIDNSQYAGCSDMLLHDEKALRELITQQPNPSSHDSKQNTSGIPHRDIDQLIRDQLQDPAVIIERNFESFQRKFDMQHRQILDGMNEIAHREGDRIIKELSVGPHNRLLDQGWHGSAKGRHFVLAIRDYYLDRAARSGRAETTATSSPNLLEDVWALDYINPSRLQSIAEAIDDDASGFITVSEANKFTSSRPSGWSLLRWLAFWAVGWQAAATQYLRKIHKLLEHMYNIIPTVHETNRQNVHDYYAVIWFVVTQITSSLVPAEVPDTVKAKFEDYVDAQEQRIRRNFKDIHYHIDDHSTLALTTGPGRIEQYLFTALFILLQRDLQIMQICQSHTVDQRELWNSYENIECLRSACIDRFITLRDTLQHQGLDPGRQFQRTYFGLFQNLQDRTRLLSIEPLVDPNGIGNEDALEMTDSAIDVLKFPLANPISANTGGYNTPGFIPSPSDEKASDAVKLIIGRWNGHIYRRDYPVSPMFSVDIHGDPSNKDRSRATGSESGNVLGTGFTIAGEYSRGPDGRNIYVFTVHLVGPFPTYASHDLTITLRGQLNDLGSALTGEWNIKNQGTMNGWFLLSRNTPEVLACRPAPIDYRENKPRALWRYAIRAAIQEVSRRRLSWTLCQRRRDIRIRCIKLLSDLRHGPAPGQAELEQLYELRRVLAPEDVCFYESMFQLQRHLICVHSVDCDFCDRPILDSRIICIDCTAQDTLDLCDRSPCRNASISPDIRPDLGPAGHTPSHTIIKARRYVFQRDLPSLRSDAWDALRRALSAFQPEEDDSETGQDEDPGHSAPAQPACIACSKPVTQPCWFCIECEAQNDTNPVPIEERLAHIEQQSSIVDRRLSQLERRSAQVDVRLSRIETMLEQILVNTSVSHTVST